MNRYHMFKKLFIILFAAIFLCSCNKVTADSPETSNLFQYALEIEDGVFSPREVDFFMSVEEVLQATGLNEDTVIERENGKVIRTNINIPGFPYDTQVSYGFADNTGEPLMSISYHIIVDEAAESGIYDLLYEQAVSFMPEAFGNTIEGIKDGIGVSWEDKEQNYVWLSFSNDERYHPDPTEVICLQLSATKNPSFVPEELKSIMENSFWNRRNQEIQ